MEKYLKQQMCSTKLSFQPRRKTVGMMHVNGCHVKGATKRTFQRVLYSTLTGALFVSDIAPLKVL